MRPVDAVRAVFYPLTEAGVLIPMLVFWALATLAASVGLLGLWLAVVIVPAIFRYQVILVEARSRDMTPQTPGIEFFNWAGNLWSLFPALIAVAVAMVSFELNRVAGTAAMMLFVAFAGSVYPAMLGVLAVTHSPMQSVNPAAIVRFIRRCGTDYWYAPVYLFFAACVSLFVDSLGGLLASLIEMFLVFSLHSLIGSMIQPHGIIDDVYIPEATESPPAVEQAVLDRQRTQVLNHAYGFVSRDNRSGGFAHIRQWIDGDPDPAGAWAWFFEQMLGWEDQKAALFFAQHYLHDLLKYGEHAPAVKLMMRCRHIDETFRPLRDDVDAAIAAADAVANAELAAALRRN